MFMAYVILKLSRSKMKLSRLKNFTNKNDPPPSLPPRIIIESSSGTHLNRCLLHSTQHEKESFPKVGAELKMSN